MNVHSGHDYCTPLWRGSVLKQMNLGEGGGGRRYINKDLSTSWIKFAPTRFYALISVIMTAGVCFGVDLNSSLRSAGGKRLAQRLLSYAVYPAGVPCRNQPICVCWKAWWSYEPGRGERVMMDEPLTAQGGRVVCLSLSMTGEPAAQVLGSFHNPWLLPYTRGKSHSRRNTQPKSFYSRNKPHEREDLPFLFAVFLPS